MTALPKQKMTVDEYLVWAQENPGRYELSEGEVFAQASERLGHARTKFAIQSTLLAGVKRAGLDCHMVPDGATVRISDQTAYEPDALIYCGPRRSDMDLEVPDPVIVVEVVSPSSRRIDNSVKLSGYFGLISVRHYLILDVEKRLIVVHSRQAGSEAIATRIIRDGEIVLEPPGIVIDCESCFPLG